MLEILTEQLFTKRVRCTPKIAFVDNVTTLQTAKFSTRLWSFLKPLVDIEREAKSRELCLSWNCHRNCLYLLGIPANFTQLNHIFKPYQPPDHAYASESSPRRRRGEPAPWHLQRSVDPGRQRHRAVLVRFHIRQVVAVGLPPCQEHRPAPVIAEITNRHQPSAPSTPAASVS